MPLLGAYWHDIQFQNGSIPSVVTTAGHYRSGYAQCSLRSAIGGAVIPSKSNAFLGGAITSGWVSCRSYISSTSIDTNHLKDIIIGFGQSTSSKGLVVGTQASGTTQHLTLYTYDGSALTSLAAESGVSIIGQTVQWIAMQVISWGATATVNAYIDGVLVISFTGDITQSSTVTNTDAVIFGGGASALASNVEVSEVMVSSDDIRAYLGLQTLALTGPGTTTQFSNNTYTNINGTTYTDATPAYDNTNGHQQQYDVTDPISPGSFTYVGVVQAARMAKSVTTPAVTKIALGYLNVNQTLGPSYGTGSTKTLTTVPTCYEQIDLVDPTTGVAFVQADMTAEQLSAKAVT